VAAYVNAYQLLLDQAPYHDYFTLTERFLAETAVPFNYSSAEDGSLREGTLLVTVGAVFRVKRGRSATGVDTLFVNTRPHDWFGYLGDPVRIVAPKYRSYQQGETVSAIGWYDGWCDVNDDAGITRRYPCIVAAGVVPAR
jgi:hypothetical protein